jgi:dTDP-glucose 4,6-dehydratase
VDITKIRDELGYQPEVPFAEGLAQTVEWYRSRRDWWEPLKKRAAVL